MTVEDGTPLRKACFFGQLEAVLLLLEARADINEGGGTLSPPLGRAAQQGRTDVVRLLLDSAADMQARWGMQTPASIASLNRHWDVVELLEKADSCGTTAPL